VSIALAAVSGGMFEEGDDLPTLGASPERLALVKNADLIDMARLGRSSFPADLMTYAARDRQPSVFVLKESNRQSILTVFNWSEGELKRSIRLADLGLKNPEKYQITGIFGDKSCCDTSADAISVVQSAHSVRMFKLIERGVEAAPPAFDIRSAKVGKAGDIMRFSAERVPGEEPALTFHWDFGDGSSQDGTKVYHAYTQSGEYTVRITATGLDASTNSKTLAVRVSGNIATRFVPAEKKRAE